MTIIIFELLFILLLTITNGLFSMSELAIVSARQARLQQQAKKGDVGARVALELAGAPNDFLSTVQIGITLIGILAGAVGGTNIAEQIKVRLSGIPIIGHYSEAIGVGVVVILITYLSLVIGELLPKRLALSRAEGIAVVMSRPMRLIAKITSPAVRFLSLSTEGLLRLFGVRSSSENPVTEEEIKILIHQGAQAGMFEQAEREMVEGVFRLGDKRVSSLMTPRKDIIWLDINSSVDKIRSVISSSIYSRFPVANDNLDKVVGVVQAKDLLDHSLAGNALNLQMVLHSPLFIPEIMPALKALETFKKFRKHIALVVDEYGGVQGLITIHDILEAIVGDIPVEDESDSSQMVKRDDGSFLLDGMLPIDKIKEALHIEQLPNEDKGYYYTLAGFIVSHMGHLPTTGEHFEWNGFRFEVMDMDGHRVDKVLVVPKRADRIVYAPK
ncbi:MAG: hemolysin family protein [Acidobacteriota bacterium]